MIRLALNQNSCKNFSLVDFIKFSKNFNGVELNFKKIRNRLSENMKLKDILELLESYGLKVSSIFRLKDFSLSSERDYNTKVLSNLKQMIDFCYKLDSDLLIVNPSVLKSSLESNQIPKWRIINRTRKRLEDISKKAYKNDINIGFEFINLPDSSIPTLSDAKEVIEPLAESQENLGYIIDTFYFAKNNVNFNQLNDIKDLILLIQLSDLKYTSFDELSSLENSDRVFPGNGNFECKKFLNFVLKMGYRKIFSIELSKKECSKNLYKKFFTIFK